MVKTIIFDSYDEATILKTIEPILAWPKAGPEEISVPIGGKRFVLTGFGNTKDEYLASFTSQANAIQQMLTTIK